MSLVQIDRQPHEWSEARLVELKHRHEDLMRRRTAHGQRSGIVLEPPPAGTQMGWLLAAATEVRAAIEQPGRN
jgi:hypothetical protein